MKTKAKKARQGAISIGELNHFGCPHCGYRSIYTNISMGGLLVAGCGECQKSFYVLADGLEVSDVKMNGYYPRLIDHPRRGTPSHGSPDLRPENGGEHFTSRGIGTDFTRGCMVCGGDHNRRYNNIAAYVQCKAAGERIVRMFADGAVLDFREHSPDYVQVKIGACDPHLPKLHWLHDLTREADRVITTEIVLRVLRSRVPKKYLQKKS